jgi:peptidoglycan/xylan/chitin deacetylase (PgdA/CDA1 family)
MTARLPRGVFTLSLDFELIWGTLDLFGPDRFREACRLERGVVFERLLGLLEEFEISATWCVLGHLLLDRCDSSGGPPHPEIVRPTHHWHPGDWFRHDPASDEARAPLFYGATLVERLRASRTPQEIGCHSFSHVIFGDRGCSRETARSEIAACVAAARPLGLELRSFAFPRNSVGHLDVLAEFGFRCYRGPSPTWFERRGSARPHERLGHLFDVLRAAEPPAVAPEPAAFGLINVPASMILFPMHGARRHIPVSRRIQRMQRGLEAAVRQRRVFHLWFHPTNLADEPELMFGALRTTLQQVRRLREQGALEVRTMGELAA